MATSVLIYRRNRDTENRYQSIEEGRGIKTGTLKGPFYIRITSDRKGGKSRRNIQPWIKLDAETFEEAKAERERHDNGEEPTTEATNRVTLRNAVTEFLDQKKRKNQSTVEAYTFILGEFIKHTSAKYVDEINRKALDNYVTWLEKERGAAPKTIENKVMVVVFMLKAAGVPKPYDMVRDLLPTVEEEIAEPYGTKELEKLFAAMDEEELARYTFFLVTAAREKEVAHAQWKDIVMKGNVPHFAIQAKKFTLTNGKPGVFTPKNHERRDVPLTNELVDLLKTRQKGSKSEFIFTNENGDPEGHFLRKFKKVAYEAGLNCGKCHTTRMEGPRWRADKKPVEKCCATYNEGCEKYYLHRLRKTRATFWHHEGISLRTIQSYLGHADLRTTQKYLGIQDSAEVIDKINKPMF